MGSFLIELEKNLRTGPIHIAIMLTRRSGAQNQRLTKMSVSNYLKKNRDPFNAYISYVELFN